MKISMHKIGSFQFFAKNSPHKKSVSFCASTSYIKISAVVVGPHQHTSARIELIYYHNKGGYRMGFLMDVPLSIVNFKVTFSLFLKMANFDPYKVFFYVSSVFHHQTESHFVRNF